MQLTSPAFEDGAEIPQRHGKKIDNISPPLSWADAPAGVQSFALSVVDRHPVARNYVHWLVVDLGPDVSALAENAATGRMPAGARELRAYAGPFPPSGTHEYAFTLYALGVAHLDVPKGASLEAFVGAVEAVAIDEATLVGRFTKQRG